MTFQFVLRIFYTVYASYAFLNAPQYSTKRAYLALFAQNHLATLIILAAANFTTELSVKRVLNSSRLKSGRNEKFLGFSKFSKDSIFSFQVKLSLFTLHFAHDLEDILWSFLRKTNTAWQNIAFLAEFWKHQNQQKHRIFGKTVRVQCCIMVPPEFYENNFFAFCYPRSHVYDVYGWPGLQIISLRWRTDDLNHDGAPKFEKT